MLGVVLAFGLLCLLIEAMLMPCPSIMGYRASHECAGVLRARAQPILRLHCRQLGAVDWQWLRANYGFAEIYAQQSSRTIEDTTSMEDSDDALDEKKSTS